jgi:2-polyprenyl-3-methyl-5-hydroxy-6-metoxy-1,4-benzoquinol methylase
VDCGFVRVEPFAGYGIYDQAYYEGRGADPFVNYAAEYHNYQRTDRRLEFEDCWRIAGEYFSGRHPAGELAWLDFGCGAGGLLQYLRMKGAITTGAGARPLQVAGHDVGAYANKLRDDDGFRIWNLAELEAVAARFDVISLIEVIEHIPEPGPVIGLCARLLRPGGLLLLTTGNFDCPMARRQGIAYRYCIPEIHVSLFSPASLAALYERHGLKPWTARYDGSVKFKVLKSVPARWRPTMRVVLRLPGITRLIDRLHGVSLMPSACKPA